MKSPCFFIPLFPLSQYGSFDKLAKKHKVFKIETIGVFDSWDVALLQHVQYFVCQSSHPRISFGNFVLLGDCYVAVTGLPVAQPRHALQMVRFARDCLSQTTKVTRQLEGRLGPDTCNLEMRVGLHSGSVTAGVLRGEKARFQLFG